MNRRKIKLLFNFAIIAYTSFLCFYLLLLIVDIFNDKDLTVTIPIIAAFCGLFPVAFMGKGFMWARYYVGVFAALACFVSFTLPLALHPHERTPVLYLILALAIFVFGLNTYVMLIHKGIEKLLRDRRK